MKNKLCCQSSEYDCGTASLVNALRFLYDREQIPPELLKMAALSTLDRYNHEGKYGHAGTSPFALRYLAEWFNDYAVNKHFPINAEFLGGDDVKVTPESEIIAWIRSGGAAVFLCFLEGDRHYVLLTGVEGGEILLFDPYDEDRETFVKDNPPETGIVYVEDDPCRCNRRVPMEILNRETCDNYAPGPLSERTVLLLRADCRPGNGI